MEIKVKIVEIIKEICDHLTIKEEDLNSTLKELGIDSLETANILLNIEEEFDITILDEDIDKLKTIGDLVIYVTQKIENNK